jgi:hypothetical protein
MNHIDPTGLIALGSNSANYGNSGGYWGGYYGAIQGMAAGDKGDNGLADNYGFGIAQYSNRITSDGSLSRTMDSYNSYFVGLPANINEYFGENKRNLSNDERTLIVEIYGQDFYNELMSWGEIVLINESPKDGSGGNCDEFRREIRLQEGNYDYNPFTEFGSFNTVVHELFHIYEFYLFMKPSLNFKQKWTWAKTDFDRFRHDHSPENWSHYDAGDYSRLRTAGLQKINELWDIETHEGQARMFGDFAQLYLSAKAGRPSFTNKENRQEALYEIAGILGNAGFQSEAINWVLSNISKP